MLNKSKALLRAVFVVSAGCASVAVAQNLPFVTALPPLDIPETQYDQEAMANLGSLLFFDTRLSGDSSTSCASCHNPSAGWGDASDLSRGYPGTSHWRNSQTLINSAYLTEGLHWDGTVPSFEDQLPGAMGTSVAHNIDQTLAEERLRQIPEYVRRYDDIWGEEPTIERTAQAMGAFERTLVSTDSPFDKFSRGEENDFSESALRGIFLFQGKANCSACHNGPLTTDAQFHNTSVPPNPAFLEDPLRQITFRTMMRGFGIEKSVYDTFDRDPGRYLATGDNADLGAMRTPPLRYLRYTAPYMHNGAFYTLEEVVDFYNQGGSDDVFGTKSPLIQPLGLSAQERADLVAFLESMSGPEVIVDMPELPDYEIVSFGGSAGPEPTSGVASTDQAENFTPSNTSPDSVESTEVITIEFGSDNSE